jgi:hypothetical protein
MHPLLLSIAKATWMKLAAFIAIACAYVFCAPNYAWVEETTNPAYGADFLQEWVGARMILTGNASTLYDLETFKAWQYNPDIVGFAWHTNQYFPPVYPPPHYLAFTPLACLPYRWATLIWLLSLIAAAFLSTKFIADIAVHHTSKADASQIPIVRRKSQYLWMALLLFPSLLFSITLGQKSIYWLLLACMTWRLLQSNRECAAGMVFGILSIKPTLFFLLPLVLLRYRRWRFFVGASLSVGLIWGTAACILPIDTWIAFARSLRNVGNYAENSGYRLEWSCNLMTLAYSVPADWTYWCKWGFCLPLSIYIVFSVFEDKAYAVDSPEKSLMLLGSTVLISPHLYHYDLCILLLPILWLAATSTRLGTAYYLMLAVAVSVAAEAQEYLQIPVVPILIVGMICELRLRTLVQPGQEIRPARIGHAKLEPAVCEGLKVERT